MPTPYSSIIVGPRQREINPTHAQAIAESIALHGLIQPLVINRSDNYLVAGGHRYAAIGILGWEQVPDNCIRYFEDLTPSAKKKIELEENVRRLDIGWKDRVKSIAEIHSLHRLEKMVDGEVWEQRQTGELLNMTGASVSYAIDLAPRLSEERFARCTSLTDALKVRADERMAEIMAERAKRQVGRAQTNLKPVDPKAFLDLANEEGIKQVSPIQAVCVENNSFPLSSKLLLGSCLDHMRSMPEASLDCVLTDVPYGIDMDNLEQNGTGHQNIAVVKEQHDVDDNLILLFDFIPEVFRVLKEKSFFVFWYDLEYHSELRNLCEKTGFTVQRWPLTWVKTHGNFNGMPHVNFTKTTEHAMVCRKGLANLSKPQSQSYWIGNNVEERTRFKHPFAKPIAMWKWLIEACTYEGQLVYEPFAGRGSLIQALIESHRDFICSELDPTHYNELLFNVEGFVKQAMPGVVIV